MTKLLPRRRQTHTETRLSDETDMESGSCRQSQLSIEGYDTMVLRSTSRADGSLGGLDTISSRTCVAIQNDRTEMADHNIFERGEVKNVLNETEMRMNKRLLAERKRMEIIMERKIDDLKKYLFREYKLDK